jgi:hypothetical protein
MAVQVLDGAVKCTHMAPPPPPPVLVGVPAAEYWFVTDVTPGTHCGRCNAPPEAMQRHWKRRDGARICLQCKESTGTTRGWPQYSAAECIRVVEERIEGLSQEELAALRDFGDSLAVEEWEDLALGREKAGKGGGSLNWRVQ